VGSPPDRVAGFYRLKRAPWTLVIIAPGEQGAVAHHPLSAHIRDGQQRVRFSGAAP
jgi:hypothetical protein